MAGAANFGRWHPEDLEGDITRRWCVILVRPNQQHLLTQLDPEIDLIFRQLIQMDALLDDNFNWLLNAPLRQFRDRAGLTAALELAYQRALFRVLPNGAVTPIEETLRNILRDKRLLIDERVPIPYQIPPVGAADIEDVLAFDWAGWAARTMTDGDDEAIAAQVLLQLRPAIANLIHPWATHRLRKALTQRAWTIVNQSFRDVDALRFTQNAARLVEGDKMKLIEMLMTFQFNLFMEPRLRAGLPVLDDLIEYSPN